MKVRKTNILLISLWMLVIFSIFAVGLYKIVMPQISIASRLQQWVLSSHAVRGICLYAKLELEDGEEQKAEEEPKEPDYDSLYELGKAREGGLGLVHYKYSFIDQESKININFMPVEVLERLPAMTESIAEKIIESPLRPFHTKEELLTAGVIDEELFSKFSEFITTYSNGTVNINTAPKEVLVSLGFDENLADIIISFRAGEDRKEGTEDDGVFESSGSIIKTLKSFAGLFAVQQFQLLNAVSKGWVGVKGEFFLLRIETEILGKKAFNYDIIMDKDKVLKWREG